METPKTVGDVLQMLERYHRERQQHYQQLADSSNDASADVLLRKLVELEGHSRQIIESEREQVSGERTTYLSLGPMLSAEAMHASDCRCESGPTLEEALDCAWKSDELLGELFDRLAASTAAPSVVHLAERLREVEQAKARQIANFMRDD